MVLGLWLLVAPAVLGTITTEGASPWNSWVLGVAIAVMALLGLAIPNSKAPESVNIVLGAWLFVSPWVLGFAGLAAAAWNACIHTLAPVCNNCGVKVVGHGLEANSSIYCCSHCAREAGHPRSTDPA